MDKKLDIKNMLPKLSPKDRAKIILEDTLTAGGLLSEEERRSLLAFTEEDQLNDFREHLQRAWQQRNLLADLFFDTFHDLQYKAAALLWIYDRIYSEDVFRAIRHLLKTTPHFIDEREYQERVANKKIELMEDLIPISELAEGEAFAYLSTHRDEYPQIAKIFDENEVVCAFDLQLFLEDDGMDTMLEIWRTIIADQKKKIEKLIADSTIVVGIDPKRGENCIRASSWYTFQGKLDVGFNGSFEAFWKEDATAGYALTHSILLHDKTEGGESVADIEKDLCLKCVDALSLFESNLDFEKEIETISFRAAEQPKIKKAVEVISQLIAEMIDLRETIKKIDNEFGNPAFPALISGAKIDECLRETKTIQKRHNDAIFHLLKRPPINFELVSFKREISDLNSYILRLPKPREEKIREYLDLTKVEKIVEKQIVS
jgi:hypothetical protein